MQSQWGNWTAQASENKIQFYSVAARNVFEQSEGQLERATKSVESAFHAWSDWNQAQSNKISR
jgi:hypothetical protein